MQRVYLWQQGSSEFSAKVLRDAFVFNADYLCNGDQGRSEGETIYEWVTERRQSQNTIARRNNPHVLAYQSCGDLIHSNLFLCGCRDEYLVNRTSDNGKIPWIVGVNISRISRHPAFSHFQKAEDIALCLPGDVLILLGEKPGTEHACILDRFNLSAKTIKTYDYGQFNPKTGKYCGHAVYRSLELNSGKAWLGSASGQRKYILGKLDISKVTFKESAIVPNDFPYGILDDNPYYDDQEKIENFSMLDLLFRSNGIIYYALRAGTCALRAPVCARTLARLVIISLLREERSFRQTSLL